jgi:hypothetical protein
MESQKNNEFKKNKEMEKKMNEKRKKILILLKGASAKPHRRLGHPVRHAHRLPP